MWYGVAAAKQAVADAGLEITDENREDIGVVFGSGAGGQSLMIDNWQVLDQKGPNRVAPTFIANGLVDSTSGMIAIETGAIGHNICVVTACSTGTNCVGEAAEIIRRGDVHTIISGSTRDAAARGRARRVRQHARARARRATGESHTDVSRPFDRSRDGFVLGEGAGSLILEDLEYAKARGAHIYAEVVGYGSAADGWDMVQPIERGSGSARAMRAALERRGVPADEVDVINPHGTSTPLGDKREAEAIWTVFGDRAAADRKNLAISGTKSMTGHMMGAAGAFEAFATVMTLAEQCVPGTINYREFDPEADLWVVPETHAAARPLRAVEQHRARRPQRRHHLQALGRQLTTVGQPPDADVNGGGSLAGKLSSDASSTSSSGARATGSVAGLPAARPMVLDDPAQARPGPWRPRARGLPRGRARWTRPSPPPRVHPASAGRRASAPSSIPAPCVRPGHARCLRYNPGDLPRRIPVPKGVPCPRLTSHAVP